VNNALDDPLGIALESAPTVPGGEMAFLRTLATQSVLVILSQPPGAGDAAPERNLVELRRADNVVIVPLFTAANRLPGMFPPPNVLVRVPLRTLLSVGGVRQYVINPLSPMSWSLTEANIAVMRATIAEQGLSSDGPSREAPWAFRAPADHWFAVAYALATWFLASGRVQTAYMYELARGGMASVDELVLAIDEPADPVLALTLRQIAIGAGAPAERFVVRFLPDEPSHRTGLAEWGLEPFYRRPKST
jgi:SseB protein N-terminal domain